jgi:hypothetical protein
MEEEDDGWSMGKVATVQPPPTIATRPPPIITTAARFLAPFNQSRT